jgi:hypothetical protein
MYPYRLYLLASISTPEHPIPNDSVPAETVREVATSIIINIGVFKFVVVKLAMPQWQDRGKMVLELNRLLSNWGYRASESAAFVGSSAIWIERVR